MNGTKLDLEGRNSCLTYIWQLKFEYEKVDYILRQLAETAVMVQPVLEWKTTRQQQQQQSKIVSLVGISASVKTQKEIQQ